MKIASLSLKVPSVRVTNKDILNYITEHSPTASPLTLKTYRRIVDTLLKKSGADTRYMRDKDSGETAALLIKAAMHEAIKNAGMDKSDLDLIIYCGVGKGFLEPANAYFYAKALGIDASCYDIVDACMSWVRALEISYQMLKSGRYRSIMILNGEFNAFDYGLPELFKIKTIRQLEYTFPAYTIGEAASATIVTRSEDEWTFTFKSVPELCDICTIPLDGYTDYIDHNPQHGINGVRKFTSFGSQLFKRAVEYLPPLLKETIGNLDGPSIYFPHAASSTAYLSVCRDIGIKEGKVFADVFPTYGNLVSASIPAGMVLAQQMGRLKRGDKVVLIPCSAGMAFAIVEFDY